MFPAVGRACRDFERDKILKKKIKENIKGFREGRDNPEEIIINYESRSRISRFLEKHGWTGNYQNFIKYLAAKRYSK